MARKTRRRRIKRSRRVKGVKGTRRYYRGGMEMPPFMTDAFNKLKDAGVSAKERLKAHFTNTSLPPQ